jgi:hypothetical protein
MSTLARRVAAVPRWGELPLTRVVKSYFLLGQKRPGHVGHSWEHRQERRVLLAASCTAVCAP